MMIDLKALSLSFYKRSILTDETLQLLSVPIANLVELESLTLSFQKSVKDLQDGIIQLSKSFANLSNLKNFHLNLDWCKEIPEKGLVELARSLREMPLLQNLYISLRECQSKALVFERIFDSFAASPDLVSLKLNFPKCPNLGNEAILRLGMALPKLEFLTELGINLSSCHGFSAETFGSFLTSLGALTKLEILKLKLEKLQLKDEQASLIAKTLSNLNCLTNFELDLSNCDYIKDNGVIDIKNSIVQHKSLKFVSLNFYLCERITNISKTRLVNLSQEKSQLWSYNLIL